MIFPVAFPSFEELVEDPYMPPLLTDKSFPAILKFDKSSRIPGGCKFAYFGESNIPIFANATSNKICLKEAYYIARETGNRVAYDPAKQGEMLTSEVKCSKWANALMSLVYDFIKAEHKKRGEPPFPIPKMRYVMVALAVAQHGNTTYLLEEFIDESDGGFRKYINNTAAVPLSTTDLDRKEIGDFLVFTQHVQYVKTEKLAFVSDQQGSFQ